MIVNSTDGKSDTTTINNFIEVLESGGDAATPTPIETPKPGNPDNDQEIAELSASTSSLPRSKNGVEVTITAFDEDDNLLEGVSIRGETFGRGSFVEPPVGTTDSRGQAKFVVGFKTFRKISSAKFSSQGKSVTVNQN